MTVNDAGGSCVSATAAAAGGSLAALLFCGDLSEEVLSLFIFFTLLLNSLLTLYSSCQFSSSSDSIASAARSRNVPSIHLEAIISIGQSIEIYVAPILYSELPLLEARWKRNV